MVKTDSRLSIPSWLTTWSQWPSLGQSHIRR